MCTDLCRRIINPSARLVKMLFFLRIIIITNLIIPILRALMDRFDDLINDLLCVFILWAATESCNFLIAGFYIMIVIINNLISFFLIGAYIQAITQGAVLKTSHVLFLCMNIFIFLFYSFAVVIVFPAYKEMKAVFMQSVGAVGAARPEGDLEANPRSAGSNNFNSAAAAAPINFNNGLGSRTNVNAADAVQSQEDSFVPFAGRGM